MSSTVAYPQMKYCADRWEDLYPSAVCSGISGDEAHRERGGYHIGRRWNPARNYSVVRRDDRAGQGPDDASSAIDMTMNRKDLVAFTRRVEAVFNNPNDPRRKYLNAVNGWLGSGPAVRFDMVARKRSRATPDHKKHAHAELRRRYVGSRIAVDAVLSMFRGETVAQYLRGIGVKAPSAAPRPAAKPAGKPAAKPAGKPAGKPAKPAGKAAVPAQRAKPPAVPAYPGRVLRREDHGKADAAVRTWQTRMIARGWASIAPADGVFDAGLEQAVRRLQTACKVDVDGCIGPTTWPLPWTHPLGS
jgi:hypothetical protein